MDKDEIIQQLKEDVEKLKTSERCLTLRVCDLLDELKAEEELHKITMNQLKNDQLEIEKLHQELEALKAKHKEDVIMAHKNGFYREDDTDSLDPIMRSASELQEEAEQYYKQTHEA